jgi:hypothetical protein
LRAIRMPRRRITPMEALLSCSVVATIRRRFPEPVRLWVPKTHPGP